MLSACPQRGSWQESGEGTEVASHRVSHREARSHPATGVGSRPPDSLRGLSGAHEVTVPGWSAHRGGNRAARCIWLARQQILSAAGQIGETQNACT